jgi:hypothetical protein
MSRHHLAVGEHAGAPADHDDFGGLQRDLAATRQAVAGLTAKRFSRRYMVRALGVAVPAAVAVGCGDDASPTSPTSSTSTTTDATLTGLTLSSGSISPSFSAANTAYSSLGASSSAANRVATSQIALPIAQNNEVYATAGYESSARNQANITLASDNVFSDGYSLELATVSGSVAGGYTALLTVGI